MRLAIMEIVTNLMTVSLAHRAVTGLILSNREIAQIIANRGAVGAMWPKFAADMKLKPDIACLEVAIIFERPQITDLLPNTVFLTIGDRYRFAIAGHLGTNPGHLSAVLTLRPDFILKLRQDLSIFFNPHDEAAFFFGVAQKDTDRIELFTTVLAGDFSFELRHRNPLMRTRIVGKRGL